MRTRVAALLLFSMAAGAVSWLPAPVVAEGKLSVEMGTGDIDLATRTIHFRLGTVARSAEIQVFSPEGQLLHTGKQIYDKPAPPAPGARLAVRWPDLGEGHENFRVELKFTDTQDNWVTAQVIRFYVEVPHEEVEFATGKWVITDAEAAKLHEPLELLKDAADKYAELMNVALYVAGHTDTVGKPADNQRLSEKRAKAIAEHFVAGGLKGMPIFVRGFGEGALAVKTPDNVAEHRNRRAQYIISSFSPPIEGPGKWQRLR